MSAADCIKNAGFLIVSCHCTNNKFIRYQNERLNHDIDFIEGFVLC